MVILLLLKRKLCFLLPSSSPSTVAHKTTLISSSSLHLACSISGFSSAASQTNPPPITPFIVEYLINSCGFSSGKAIEASKRLTHLNSPSNPNSVVGFLKHSGLSDAHIRNLISKHPRLLCARVEKNLKPKFMALREMGFSESELIQLASTNPQALQLRNLLPNIKFLRAMLGTNGSLLKAIKRDEYLLASSLAKRVMPNLTLLRECGIPDHRITKLVLTTPRFITRHPTWIKAKVRHAEELGVPRDSGMFLHVLRSLSSISGSTFNAKFKLLRSLGWSEAEVLSAFKKAPLLLNLSEKKLRDTMKFLMEEVGCELSYVACRPVLLYYSLERRLIPRHCVLKMLNQKELLRRESKLFAACSLTDKQFIERFILPHEEKIPGLHEAYVAACAGEVPNPTSFEEK